MACTAASVNNQYLDKVDLKQTTFSMNSNAQWKNCQGTDGTNMPPRAQDPMAVPSVRPCLLFKKGSPKMKGPSGTLFSRACFAHFCARFACFLARFAHDPWIISDHIRRYCACQSRSNAKSHEVFPQSSRSKFVMRSCPRPADFCHEVFLRIIPCIKL